VNDVFSTKFGQGLRAEFGGRAGERWRATAFYGDGLRTNALSVPSSVIANAAGYAGSYTTSFSQNTTNWAFAGRVEYLGAGNWRQMRDLNSYIGDDKGWMIGLGAMGQSLRSTNEVTQTASATDSRWGITADLTMHFGGATLSAAGVYRDVQLAGNVATRGGGTSDSMGQWGAVVQGGYFLNNEVELFARYEVGSTDTDKFRVAEPGIELESNSIGDRRRELPLRRQQGREVDDRCRLRAGTDRRLQQLGRRLADRRVVDGRQRLHERRSVGAPFADPAHLLTASSARGNTADRLLPPRASPTASSTSASRPPGVSAGRRCFCPSRP
jgi:hypothetical protein